VVLEAKSQGIVGDVSTIVDALAASGMWISEKVRQRILALAGE
jgi:predicted nucleic acid-binding protein